MSREPTFIAAVGMPGVGKTYRNIAEIRKVLLGRPEKGVPPRKVLIIDNNNEYRNDNRDVRTHALHIKTIHPKQVAAFSASSYIEACRIVPFNDNGHPMSLKEFADTLNTVLKFYRDGLLIAEDFKAYTGNSLNQELVGKLATRRHSGCDTIISLQGMGMIVPTLWTNLKWLRLHKSLDPINRSDNKFQGQIQFLSIAENIVNYKYDRGEERFYVLVNLERGLIYGNYTEQEFKDATRLYISENWEKTAGKLLKHRNETGRKIYTEETAFSAELNRCQDYFSQFSSRAKR